MQSIWSDTCQTNDKSNPCLEGHINTDVLIIGGGMAGILCAFTLKQRGVDCVVVEAQTVGSGATCNTTAKLTAQHGLCYATLIKRHGTAIAKQYHDANTHALTEFERLSTIYPCDFERKTAYVFSVDNRKKLEAEASAYARLGMTPVMLDNPPLPFKTVGAIGMSEQAQFHPLKLLYALAKELKIYENTKVTSIDDNTVHTQRGSINAKHIVLATHFPFVNIPGLYFLKMYQHRSYVLALKQAPLIPDMFVDEQQDGHSFRTYQDVLLVGGGDHRTGQKGGGWEALRTLVAQAYPNAVEAYAWATQDCMTLDSTPYIGVHRQTAQQLYVATGFNKWGMTGSMTAATLLTNIIITGKSDYENLFAPSRSLLRPQLFVNIAHAAAGLVTPGKRCTHMGCKLHWNAAERSWDCGCHGSRFSRSGDVLDTPAKKDMTR